MPISNYDWLLLTGKYNARTWNRFCAIKNSDRFYDLVDSIRIDNEIYQIRKLDHYPKRIILIYNSEHKRVLVAKYNYFSKVSNGVSDRIEKAIKEICYGDINSNVNLKQDGWKVRCYTVTDDKTSVLDTFTEIEFKATNITHTCYMGSRNNTAQSRPTVIFENIPEKFKYLEDQVNEEMTFGIELEFIAVDYATVISAFVNKNYRIKDRSYEYGKSSTREWVLCYDNSLFIESNFRERCEITTPILKGKEGLKKLYNYLNVLTQLEKDGKVKVNDSCGTHIHIGNMGQVENMGRFFQLFYARNEKFIDLVFSETRRTNSYCKTCCGEYYTKDKYRKVSMRNYTINGTVENRQHEGTLSFEKISNWLILNQKMIKYVYDKEKVKESGNQSEEKSFETLLGFLMFFVLNEKSIEYFITRKIICNNELNGV